MRHFACGALHPFCFGTYPQSLETCLPAVLKQAIESHKNGTSIDRIRKRTTIMRDWVRRAELLKSSELELKSKLDPHPKQILSDKKILLWKSLLEEHKNSDMSVVGELLQGTRLTGETETTGLWPAKFVPSPSRKLSCEISSRKREAVCQDQKFPV